MKRYVDQREALKKIPAGPDRDRLERWLVRQPTAPDLISRKIAAEILGVKSPHLARFEKQGRLPEPIPIEGTAGGYIKQEIEELRDELDRERAARRAKREDA